MKIDWNTAHIIADLGKMYRGANDPYVTGWNNWPCKQDLYRVKFAVDEMLKKTSKFAGEEEWLQQHDKEQVWKALNEVRDVQK
jgi:hypothetical protein